jgi:sulfonate transport system permease protein
MSIYAHVSELRGRTAAGWPVRLSSDNAGQSVANAFARLRALVQRLGWPMLAGISLPVGLLAIWSLAVHLELLAPQILPAPSLVWTTTSELLFSGELLFELSVSLARLFVGLLIGSLLGFAFGVAFATSRALDSYVAPSVRAVFLVPSLGWLPFFMLFFGIGETLKVILIAKTCFLPLMVGAFSSIRTMPSKYNEVARCLELGRLAYFRHILLPSLVPAVATGLRQALSKGWKVLILVEMISSAAGIGYLMMWGRKSFQLDVVFATMIVIGIVGLLFDRGVLWLENRTASWSLNTAT